MKFPILIFLDIVVTIWQAFVFSILWSWFMVPIFHLPILSITQSIGIMLVVGLITHQYIPRKEEEIPNMIFFQLFTPLIALITGVFCH